ncbi:Multiple sugar-binding periplasmic protein SbpA [Streptomyces glaucescens]
MPTKSSERWIADGNNVVQHLEDKGYKTKLVYGEDDPDQQVSQIENMITQGVDALIIAAIDNKSMNNVLQQAKDADIPVISYDRLILGSPDVDYYASFDNEKVGELQGTYIVEKLGLKDGGEKGPFNIELFAGSNDDNNTRYFFQGAMNVLQPYIDKKQLVVQSGQTELTQVTTLRWDGATAQRRMDDILTKSYTGGGRRGALPVRRHLHRHPVGAEVGRLRLQEQAAAGRHRPGRRGRLGEVDHRGPAVA